jgi:hypothetical protein
MKRCLSVLAVLALFACADASGPTTDGGPEFLVTVVPQDGFEVIHGPFGFVRRPGPGMVAVETLTGVDLSTLTQPLTLHVLNGGDGVGPVTSGGVWIDGVELVDSKDLKKLKNQNPEETFLVTIVDGSKLEVRVGSSPGTGLAVWIEGRSGCTGAHCD